MFRIEFVVFILRRCGLSPSAKVIKVDWTKGSYSRATAMKSIWNAHITKISFIGLILQGNSISSAIINPLGTCQGRRSAVGVCIWASEAAVRTGMFHIFHTGMGGRVSRRKQTIRNICLAAIKNVMTRKRLFFHIHIICQTLLFFRYSDHFLYVPNRVNCFHSSPLRLISLRQSH